ncbi:uncharacterized protein LOC121430648 [Lytechinus variegatus]|uniref:uncharacterized protein LOC121430648 n=1 Tax=Lytechinus variegatus TaxID=7654 RepID=UPI001BB2B94D|nr:uncharacterized protein LOC121430648 [Lytechinus variegatus]
MKIALLTIAILVVVIPSVIADYSNVYHWHIKFKDFPCGVPSSSWSGRRKRDTYLNKWALKHSMVNFRGKYYEWGNDDVIYRDGGIGRQGRSYCYGQKSYVGRSRCTKEQADRLGAWYSRNNVYWFLFNNCHHYAEWLINRLVNNRC